MRKAPAWTGYFLRSLERLGEVRAAAEAAGVDFTSVYARRKAHAEFGEQWEAALGVFRARRQAEEERLVAEVEQSGVPDLIGTRPSMSLHADPSTIESSFDGSPPHALHREELRARRRVAFGGNGRWSQAREKMFFEELAASASVRRAAKAAGVSPQAVYARRAKSALFRTKWDAVLEVGRARLDALLVEAANRTFDPDSDPLPECEGTPAVSVAEAIRIVKMHGSKRDQASFAEEEEPPAEEMAAIRERVLAKIDRLAELHRAERLDAGWQEDERFEDALVPPGWARVEEA